MPIKRLSNPLGTSALPPSPPPRIRRVNEDMVLDIKKESFLSNKKNKQKFLNLLKRKLVEQGYDVHSTEEDADLLIVLTAVELTEICLLF